MCSQKSDTPEGVATRGNGGLPVSNYLITEKELGEMQNPYAYLYNEDIERAKIEIELRNKPPVPTNHHVLPHAPALLKPSPPVPIEQPSTAPSSFVSTI